MRTSGFIWWLRCKFHDWFPKAHTFATPRSWELVSKMHGGTMPQELPPELLAGAVGEGAATEFLGYIKVVSDCTDIDNVL